MICYQDNEDGYTQLIRFTDGEHYSEINEDLDNLIKLGVQIESITTDGHKSILKAIKILLPDVLAQRCRQILMELKASLVISKIILIYTDD